MNNQLHTCVLDYTTIEAEFVQLVSSLNKELQLKAKGAWVASSENQKLLKTYWDKEYAHRKIDKDAALNRLQRAIDALGPHSLINTPRTKMQEVIDARTKGEPRKQRALVATLNQLRRYFGITEKLSSERKQLPKFNYLTEKQFLNVVSFVEDPIAQALFTILFYSGLRIGEAYALKAHYLKGKVITIRSQIDRSGNERETKTNTSRKTLLLPKAKAAFDVWVECEKPKRGPMNDILNKACEAAKLKPVKIHDLRHSFAVMCLVDYEMTIAIVAKMLGNSISVCEDYYLNFLPEDDILLAALNKIS